MSNNQQFPSHKEIRQRQVEAEKAKIGKEYERKLFLIKHKKEIISWLKKVGLGVVALLVLWGVVVGIIRLVIYLSANKEEDQQQPITVEETEKPPAGFGVEMTEIKLLQPVAGKTTYDVMARIVNKDPDWGVSELSYTFIFKDRFDKVVAEKKRNSFILPNQSKYLIEVGAETARVTQKVELKIKMEKIQKLKKFSLPNIKVVDKSYQITDQKGKVQGELLNDSPYDFNEVNVGIVLFDSAGEVIGLNFTNVNALTAGSKRSFVASWNEEISEKVAEVYVEPQIDIFNSGVFMNNYGSGQSLDY